MPSEIYDTFSSLQPWAQTALGLLCLMALAYVLRFVLRTVLLRIVARLVGNLRPAWLQALLDRTLLKRLSQIVPSLVIQTGIYAVPYLGATTVQVIRNVAVAVTVLQVARLLCAVLDALQNYNHTAISESQSTR